VSTGGVVAAGKVAFSAIWTRLSHGSGLLARLFDEG